MGRTCRRLAYGLLLTATCGVGGLAQFPPGAPVPGEQPPKAPVPLPNTGLRDDLKADLAARLAKDAGEDPGAERARLRAKLDLLLDRILNPRPIPAPGPKQSVVPKQPTLPPAYETRSINPVREGMNQFRNNDFDVALGTFRRIDTATLGAEDRAFVQYMKATCLRRLGRLSEAVTTYREVADAHDDEFIVDCAIWQLSLIGTEQDLESTLDQLRARARK